MKYRDIFQESILIFSLLLLLCLLGLHHCSKVQYVLLSKNLSLYSKKKNVCFSSPFPIMCWYFSITMISLLLIECEVNLLLHVIMQPMPKLILFILLEFRKAISMMFFGTSVIVMFTIATSPAARLVCIFVFQTSCLYFVEQMPPWLSISSWFLMT